MSRMFSLTLRSFLIISLGLIALLFRHELLEERSISAGLNQTEESPLYLPEVKYVRLVSLGYESLLSDILWFNTLNYFGRQFKGSRDYTWLGHMCDLVTELDPRAAIPIEFCSGLLSWVVKNPQASNTVLDRGIKANPNGWRFYYFKAFNYWYFLEDFETAKNLLSEAALKPNAPSFLSSIASKFMGKTESPQAAAQFLKKMIKRSKNEQVRKALEEKYRQALNSVALEMLREAITRYESRLGQPPQGLEDLVKEKILTSIPVEPFGGIYLLDASGKPISSLGSKELSLTAKTAETGIMKKEFLRNDHMNQERMK